jgi:RNA polymerase sigma factor (sigma-70 family)
MIDATLTSRVPLRQLRSKRLLALAGEERLVEQVRRGNELAFEIVFERHGAGILSFCRHMLGSREDAEDAVQHTFAAAYSDLQRASGRTIALKAWLYTIARNRCISVLRARREQAAELHELPTEGLSEKVEQRAELRELLSDVRELPEEQRAALLLAEAAGLSHSEVAEVLGCEVARVKALVFRARSSLIERRSARETSCDDVREQLATLRGGALRRNELRHHLRRCPGCSAYREEVRRQRQLLASALPVVPSLGLKSSVMGAAGAGGALGGASTGGIALGSAAVAKVALVGVLAGGTVVAGEVAVHRAAQSDGPMQLAPAGQRGIAPTPVHPFGGQTRGAYGERMSSGRVGSERSDTLRGTDPGEGLSQGDGEAVGQPPQAGRTGVTGRALGRGNVEGGPRGREGSTTSPGQAKLERPAKPAHESRRDSLGPETPTTDVEPAPEPVASTDSATDSTAEPASDPAAAWVQDPSAP